MIRTLKLTTFALTAFLVVALLTAFLTTPNPRAGESAAVVSQINNEKLQQLYSDWKIKHEAQGGDHNVRLGLVGITGMSSSTSGASGTATLDLIDGKISVEVAGLDTRVSDVWLVDNLPGEGRSTMPDPGDRMVYVGSVIRDGEGPATLEASLDLTDLEIDRVVLTLPGTDPVDGAVLYSSTSMFQRFYTQARTGRLAKAYDMVVPADGFVDAAYANIPPGSPGGSIFIDEDVVFDKLVRLGADVFINETFDGNGRSCATCHPATNNQTLDVQFIRRLPNSDPLFVAEGCALCANPDELKGPPISPSGIQFEVPELMRGQALILENLDSFARAGLMRGIPHVLGMSVSITGPAIPFDNTNNPAFGITPPIDRTGWSGDGAPGPPGTGGGSLRDFLTGAILQHYPKILPRQVGPSFRLATDKELDAVEAFLLALGRNTERNLATETFRNPRAADGNRIFNTIGGPGSGNCVICHNQAGANVNAAFFNGVGVPLPVLDAAGGGGNANFGTGVNDLPSLPADLILAANGSNPGLNPRDGGFAVVDHDPAAGNCIGGRPGPDGKFGFGTVTPDSPPGAPPPPLPPGLCEEDFNTVSLVEAADSGPFFHNNAVNTIEGAVAFYNSDAFNDSNGAFLLRGALGFPGPPLPAAIDLEATEVENVAAMLRIINVRDNIRNARALAKAAIGQSGSVARALLLVAEADLVDAIGVLACGKLHPLAVDSLADAIGNSIEARVSIFHRDDFIKKSIEDMDATSKQL